MSCTFEDILGPDARGARYVIAGIGEEGYASFSIAGARTEEAAIRHARRRLAARQGHHRWHCRIYCIEPICDVGRDGGDDVTPIEGRFE